jgi:hypothetical protein
VARRHAHPNAPRFARAARRLGVLSIAIALSTVGIAAAAPSTTTTSSTTTSTAPGGPTTTAPPAAAPPTTVVLLPPPPPFPLGDDFGRLLPVHRAEAHAALTVATADVATNTRLQALGADHVKVASRTLVHAHEHARAVARRLVVIHDQIRVMAADAYMIGSSVQITGALSSIVSAKDVLGVSRNLTLVRSSHDRLLDLVDLERREQSRVTAEVSAATKGRDKAVSDWRTAIRNLADAQQREATARAAIDQVERDQARFFTLATTSASPIMGPSLLTADELVAYLDSLGVHPHLTVPIRTLAEYFISEGNAEGIRGDVAFAQSILETGAFMYPGHGLVLPTDNNYAGINACDSCKHGDPFASALLGVRAQMQLLRVYADPTLEKITDFANPLALLHNFEIRATGFVKTWYALGGRWATGPNYGFHIYDIYRQMVQLSERR